PNFSGLIVLNENPLMVAGSSSFVGELLNLIGIRNAYDGFQKYPVLDSEQLYVMKPDVIFNISESIMSGSTDDSKRVLSGSGIRSLSKNSVIYNLADSSFIRPSPRFIEALRMICSLTTGYFCL
ncbi:MAG: hypothetical protein N3B13_02610, partial [Deltaproteobacteria bacterium]|nr:hypothetical protein [Deltaproteobacteria bacterium]